MEITITFKDGKIIKFDKDNVVKYKYSDRLFVVVTNESKSLHLYNMNTIDSVDMRVVWYDKKYTVSDYEIKD